MGLQGHGVLARETRSARPSKATLCKTRSLGAAALALCLATTVAPRVAVTVTAAYGAVCARVCARMCGRVLV